MLVTKIKGFKTIIFLSQYCSSATQNFIIMMRCYKYSSFHFLINRYPFFNINFGLLFIILIESIPHFIVRPEEDCEITFPGSIFKFLFFMTSDLMILYFFFIKKVHLDRVYLKPWLNYLLNGWHSQSINPSLKDLFLQ